MSKPEYYGDEHIMLVGSVDGSYEELVRLLGQPRDTWYDDKTDVEWHMFRDGAELRICNYKTGKNYLGKRGKAVEDTAHWTVVLCKHLADPEAERAAYGLDHELNNE